MNDEIADHQEITIQVKPVQRAGFFVNMVVAMILGGIYAQQAGANDADLAKQLQNPIADLVSVPMKLDWDTDIGDEDADRSTYIVQPVIPVGLNDDWNVISRTIVPVYIDAEAPNEGGHDDTGMGDILQSFFFSPKAPTSAGWVWGVGPALALPTGDDDLTTEKFSVGPTAVMLKQSNGWTYGALANQLWSISGDDDAEDVNSTFLQPFLAYTTKTQTTYTINSESTYDWEAEEWTAPINFMISQLTSLGEQPVQFQFGYRDYVDSPNDTLDWGLRFTVTFLFPKL